MTLCFIESSRDAGQEAPHMAPPKPPGPNLAEPRAFLARGFRAGPPWPARDSHILIHIYTKILSYHRGEGLALLRSSSPRPCAPDARRGVSEPTAVTSRGRLPRPVGPYVRRLTRGQTPRGLIRHGRRRGLPPVTGRGRTRVGRSGALHSWSTPGSGRKPAHRLLAPPGPQGGADSTAHQAVQAAAAPSAAALHKGLCGV